MSVAENRDTKAANPPFQTGDRLSQPDFHRLYEQTPADFRAELIEGIVYVSSPMGMPHGDASASLTGVLWVYVASTPGIAVNHDSTVILDDHNEPQPDVHLRIRPSSGGQTSTKGKYLVGAPELVIEIADSTAGVDLTKKRDAYRRAGVREYIVYCCDPHRFVVFDFVQGNETQDMRSIFRSSTFGGLWIDLDAILAGNEPRMMKVIQEGLASVEHQDFVKRLANNRT